MVTSAAPKSAFQAPEGTPSVHTSETTLPNDVTGSLDAIYATSQRRRQAAAIELYQAMENDVDSRVFHGNRDEGYRRSSKLKHCHKSGWFGRHDLTGQVKLFLDSCKVRWCPLCGSARASWITFTISEWLANRDRPKFATFTVQHDDTELGYQVSNLSRYFVNLRRLSQFRSYVQGGIWFYQVKKSSSDALWHNHLHCIFDSDYYPQGELSKTWYRVTHGSDIVDIREIRNNKKISNEVARYSSNPADLSKNKLKDNVTLFESLQGKRTCGTWGTARGVQLRPSKDPEFKLWKNIGSKMIILELRKTDARAKAIYESYITGTTLQGDIDCLDVSNFLDDTLQNYYNQRDGVQDGPASAEQEVFNYG